MGQAFGQFQYPTPPLAVFDEDVIRHYQEHLAQRRQVRPEDEYRETTRDEWAEFEEHFDRRKVELGIPQVRVHIPATESYS
ncbi:hypothetical protein [Kitasatospora acidiphila]|uniref:hypothetical protein n=1 Tax=Kitasatospora acidiphila TaxID=2567942 RepID=UPI001E424BD2|nr:hypothetical protein [Kitasatospora acidiphila]